MNKAECAHKLMKFVDDILQEANKNPELEAASKNEEPMEIVND